MPSPVPAYRRMPIEQRREMILAAASALVAERGFASVPLEAFATAAGMTGPGLQHHFPTKVALLTALLERFDREEEAAGLAFAAGPVADARMAREVMDHAVERMVLQPQLLRLRLVLSVEALDASHPAHGYFARRLRDGRANIARMLFPWHPEPARAASELFSHLEGLVLDWLRDPEVDLRSEWSYYADRAIGRID